MFETQTASACHWNWAAVSDDRHLTRNVNWVPKSQNWEIYYPNSFPNHQPNGRSRLVSVALSTRCNNSFWQHHEASRDYWSDSLSRHMTPVATHYRLKRRLKRRTINRGASVYFSQQVALPAYKPQQCRLQWHMRGGTKIMIRQYLSHKWSQQYTLCLKKSSHL